MMIESASISSVHATIGYLAPACSCSGMSVAGQQCKVL